MNLSSLLLMAPPADGSGHNGGSLWQTVILFALIAVPIIILVIRSNKKKSKQAEQSIQDKLIADEGRKREENALAEKMSRLSDEGLLKILEECKQYEPNAINAAVREGKNRKLKFDYDKVEIDLEFSKSKNKPETFNEARNAANDSNGVGMAGFIISIIGGAFFWIPILCIVLLVVGFILSLVGFIVGKATKKKVGFSIAGMAIAITMIIIAIQVLSSVFNGFH